MRAAVGPPLQNLQPLEDGPVDQLIDRARDAGATLIAAHFARAYVDLNREPTELDPQIVAGGSLPSDWRLSAKARAGLGVVPSRIGGGPIYLAPLAAGEVHRRLHEAYFPYHRELDRLLAECRRRLGGAILVDCHSMPTIEGRQPGDRPIDIALGDRFGCSCHPRFVDAAQACFAAQGLHVARNRPYAGGFITEHYGRPASGMHALQIEVRRDLFMNERSGAPTADLARLAECFRDLVATLAGLFRPRAPRLETEAEPASMLAV
jgi:N-formylglutamate amidohydrolase